MNLNYCPVPGASQPRGMRFDAENSRCIPAERHRPEACFGCGLEHICSVHGCAVIRKALQLLGGEADACL